MILKSIKALLFIGVITVLLQSLTPSTPIALNPVKAIAPHVVSFKSMIHGGQRLATGFYIKFNKKTFILTNRHVCDSNKKLYGENIQFGNYVGKILSIDKKHDLCLVTSDRNEGLEIAKKAPNYLDKVFLVGFPRGIGKVIREGHIIEDVFFNIPWMENRYLRTQQISASAYGGNSGSPVCNKNGKVIGVLFAGSPMYPLEPFIVPYEYVVDFLLRATIGR